MASPIFGSSPTGSDGHRIRIRYVIYITRRVGCKPETRRRNPKAFKRNLTLFFFSFLSFSFSLTLSRLLSHSLSAAEASPSHCVRPPTAPPTPSKYVVDSHSDSHSLSLSSSLLLSLTHSQVSRRTRPPKSNPDGGHASSSPPHRETVVSLGLIWVLRTE